jgi:hypothetical protein
MAFFPFIAGLIFRSLPLVGGEDRVRSTLADDAAEEASDSQPREQA